VTQGSASSNSQSPNSIHRLRERLVAGLLAATPVPFDHSGKLHLPAHESYLRYMAQQPIAGVAVWAHTGRGLNLDKETAAKVLTDWRQALPQSVVIAGVGSRSAESVSATIDTVTMAETAVRLGADALLVYPPTWLRNGPTPDQLIVAHHKELAQLGVPMILFYLYEDAGGVSYSETVLGELLDLPEVLGIKMATLDSVMTYQDVSRQITSQHPDKLLITGEDRFLGYSLQRGARCALIGMGAICCELQAELLRGNAEGNASSFLELSNKVDHLAESLFIEPMEGYIQRLLWALVHLGVIPLDASHDPWGPSLPRDEFEAIGRTLDALMVVNQT